ncbi:MAG: hypothetical protein FWD09_00705 [Lentimicrobiaceae bacterium]|nr:hypothetical protein [Lentimicrobiaceae bacterium]
MKRTLYLITIGIAILLISCHKDPHCHVSDPFTEIRWLQDLDLPESTCITEAVFSKLGKGKREGYIFGPNTYTDKITYYGCAGIIVLCSGEECEELYEVIKLGETYCK